MARIIETLTSSCLAVREITDIVFCCRNYRAAFSFKWGVLICRYKGNNCQNLATWIHLVFFYHWMQWNIILSQVLVLQDVQIYVLLYS